MLVATVASLRHNNVESKVLRDNKSLSYQYYSWFHNIWKISISRGSSRRRPQWTKCYGNRLFIMNAHASWWKAYFRSILFIQVVYGIIHGKSRFFKYCEINCTFEKLRCNGWKRQTKRSCSSDRPDFAHVERLESTFIPRRKHLACLFSLNVFEQCWKVWCQLKCDLSANARLNSVWQTMNRFHLAC